LEAGGLSGARVWRKQMRALPARSHTIQYVRARRKPWAGAPRLPFTAPLRNDDGPSGGGQSPTPPRLAAEQAARFGPVLEYTHMAYGTTSWSGVSVSRERLRQRGLWRGTARSYDKNKVDRLHIEKQNRAFLGNIGPDSNRAANCVQNESPVAGSRDCPLRRPTM
jgi:hypothetical protein